jgi:hypothetical protein
LTLAAAMIAIVVVSAAGCEAAVGPIGDLTDMFDFNR